MAIVKELKNLGKKMTGADLTGNTVSEALKAIEEKYTGGSSDTYETVAEIEVGEMTEQSDVFVYTAENVTIPTLNASDVYYLNNSENASSFVLDDTNTPTIGYNFSDFEDPTPIDPKKPIVGLRWVKEGDICNVISSSDALSNTTVKILKKASAQSGGGKFVVTLTETEEGGDTVYTADKTVAECIAADAAGQVVECAFSFGRLPLISIEGDYMVFAVQTISEGSIVQITVEGRTEEGTDTWSVLQEIIEIPDRLVVTLTKTGTGSEAVFSADKSFNEIKAALDGKEDVEVLLPYDFGGALTDPTVAHLYPIGYQAVNETVSLIGFASLPTFSEIGFSSASVTCQYNSTLDETTWNVVWNKIAQSKEFAFTATPDGQGGFTVTPADGVTYVAILNAMASSPLVFANISVPAINTTVIAQFSSKNSVGGNGNVTASIVGYFNGAYSLMELYMRSDGTNGVTVVPLVTQS